jgi:hypothetical protein
MRNTFLKNQFIFFKLTSSAKPLFKNNLLQILLFQPPKKSRIKMLAKNEPPTIAA